MRLYACIFIAKLSCNTPSTNFTWLKCIISKLIFHWYTVNLVHTYKTIKKQCKCSVIISNLWSEQRNLPRVFLSLYGDSAYCIIVLTSSKQDVFIEAIWGKHAAKNCFISWFWVFETSRASKVFGCETTRESEFFRSKVRVFETPKSSLLKMLDSSSTKCHLICQWKSKMLSVKF